MPDETLRVTPADQFRQGDLVRLPSGRVVRIRPLPLTALLTAGVIPNKLLAVAEKYAAEGTKAQLVDKEVREFLELINFVVQVALIEPRIVPLIKPKTVSEDLAEILSPPLPEGCITHFDLTDEDRMFIFDYAQRGPEALKPFRAEPHDGAETGLSSGEVRTEAEQPAGDN